VLFRSGYYLAKTPFLNKGSSFMNEERNTLGIRGLFPAGEPLSLDVKVEIAMEQFAKKTSPLEKYIFLHTIQDSDETLFYAILSRNTFAVLPFVYTPTVGEACQQWSRITRHTPRGLYLSIHDKGQIRRILDNYPLKDIKVIVVTDGERILGLGDLGVNGMGIPIGKLALYTACAGINPNQVLPVHIDVGTNNQEFLKDPAYMGLRQQRIRGAPFEDLVQEFFDACQDAYGRNVLIQFEDFGNSNAFHLLEKHMTTATCFNDDIQGTASVVLAGLISSLPLCGKSKLADHVFLFNGAGEAGVGIANQIAFTISTESDPATPISLDDARKKIWLVDSKGLVYRTRPDYESMPAHKKIFAHDLNIMMQAILDNEVTNGNTDALSRAIKAIQPSGLIGVSAQGGSFTKYILEYMGSINEKPLIFSLSNPTFKSECTAEQAYKFTDGRCVFASGSPFDPVTLSDGRRFVPGQGNNAYIFPGVGLGALISGANTITDHDFYVAAKCLASIVSNKETEVGCVYPPIQNIRDVSARIAAAVAENIFDTKRNSIERPVGDILDHCKHAMYTPSYD